MELRIKGTDYTVTGEVKNYLETRLEAVERHLGADAELALCEVELGRAVGHSKNGEVWKAEINLTHQKEFVRATATAETINAAIDHVKSELLDQLQKRKQIHRRFLRKGGNLLKGLMRAGRA
jgi:ribosomal subunit interface protein